MLDRFGNFLLRHGLVIALLMLVGMFTANYVVLRWGCASITVVGPNDTILCGRWHRGCYHDHSDNSRLIQSLAK